MDHFKADPLSRQDIRNMANRLRKQLGISPKKPVDVIRLLEMLFPAAYGDSGFRYEILHRRIWASCTVSQTQSTGSFTSVRTSMTTQPRVRVATE